MNGIPQNLEVDLIVSMNNPVSHVNDLPEIGNGFAQGVIQFSRFVKCLSNNSELEQHCGLDYFVAQEVFKRKRANETIARSDGFKRI